MLTRKYWVWLMWSFFFTAEMSSVTVYRREPYNNMVQVGRVSILICQGNMPDAPTGRLCHSLCWGLPPTCPWPRTPFQLSLGCQPLPCDAAAGLDIHCHPWVVYWGLVSVLSLVPSPSAPASSPWMAPGPGSTLSMSGTANGPVTAPSSAHHGQTLWDGACWWGHGLHCGQPQLPARPPLRGARPLSSFLISSLYSGSKAGAPAMSLQEPSRGEKLLPWLVALWLVQPSTRLAAEWTQVSQDCQHLHDFSALSPTLLWTFSSWFPLS